MKYLGQITDDNDLVNKKYVDDVADDKQDTLSAGHNISLEDNEVSQTNSYVHYGSTPPSDSVDGDLWYDPEEDTLVNEFQSPINLATGSTAPTNQSVGDLWLDTGAESIYDEISWELINSVETTEESASITIDKDSEGNSFALKKARIFVKLMPNSQSQTGWTRIFFNSGDLNAIDMSSGLTPTTDGSGKYVLGQFFVEIMGGRLIPTFGLISRNSTTIRNCLGYYTNCSLTQAGGHTTGDLYLAANSINKIVYKGYQSNVLGIGTKLEIWGVRT